MCVAGGNEVLVWVMVQCMGFTLQDLCNLSRLKHYTGRRLIANQNSRHLSSTTLLFPTMDTSNLRSSEIGNRTRDVYDRISRLL